MRQVFRWATARSTAALITGILCTLGIGVTLADRFVRGLSHGMGDLAAATPHSLWARLPAILAASLGIALVLRFRGGGPARRVIRAGVRCPAGFMQKIRKCACCPD